MKTDVTVKDVMSPHPISINFEAPISMAARKMKRKNVGSLIVTEKKKPVGIITESDILKKVVAEDKPSNTLVKDIMSSPLIGIDPKTGIEEAIKIMGKKKIRRLPIIENGNLVGMATQKDILNVSPMLLEVAREWASIAENNEIAYKKKTLLSGKCEGCGMLSNRLRNVDGILLCEYCADSEQ